MPASARIPGRVLLAPAWALVSGLLLVAGAHVVGFDRNRMFEFADAYTLWIYLPAYFIAVAAASFRHYLLAIAAAVVVVAQCCWVIPPMLQRVSIPAAARSAPHFRVVSANLNYGNDHHTQALAELEADDADVLVLEEITPAWWQAIEHSALFASHHYFARAMRADAGGIALLSRTPLTDVVQHDTEGWPVFTAAISVGGRRVHLVGVHTVAPLLFGRNHRQEQEITSIVRGMPGPRIVAGDFNASPYNRWFHQLLGLGLHEAHDAVGRPFATTWPNGTHHHLPPLRLDHLFADPALVPLRAAEGRGTGSDHRPIIVDLAVVPGADPLREK